MSIPFPPAYRRHTRFFRLHPLHFAATIALLTGMAFALSPVSATGQSSKGQAIRIIGGTAFVSLPGNTHPVAQTRFDRGLAPATLAAERQVLLLKRTAQQETGLEAFLARVQDPHSSDYRKFITPEQFGALYGPSERDVHAVISWLQAQGFTVNHVNKGRTAIEFSGTVGQLQTAFQTPIHSFVVDGQQHWANVSDPMIPATLSPLVAGIASLNDFNKPHSYLVAGPTATWNPSEHRFQPDLTVTGNGMHYLFVGPGDAATIYDAPDSLNTRLPTGQTTYDGTGVTIGIVSNVDASLDGYSNYRSVFGLPQAGISRVYDGSFGNLPPTTTPDTETLLDLEISGGLAPGANLALYLAGDTVFQSGVILATYRAIEDNAVNILSVSYGNCEANIGASGNLQILSLGQQAAAQGIAVVVASGDSGSAGCDNFNTETAATQGLAVNGLASTPYNLAIGGTDFDVLPGQFTTYVSSTNGTNYTSALSYIPEEPWNDSTSVNGNLSANSATTLSGKTNIVAGGGGASSQGNPGTNNTLSGYPKPAWQAGYAPSNNDSVRDLPDVSLFSADGMYRATWALCGDRDCSGSAPTISGVGGTSASTPAFAGILALVNQKVGASTRLGQAAWVLYDLAQTQPAVFHQVATGNNSVYCKSGSPNCGANSFLSGYNAGSGYNLATGLGSVDITKLVNGWQNVSLNSTQTTLNLSQTSFVHGAPVNITATVNPSSATGTVAIIKNTGSSAPGAGGTNPAPTDLPLTASSASGTYTQFPGGQYNLYANYPGDGTYAGSTSQPVAVTVSPEDSVVRFSGFAETSNYVFEDLSGKTVPLGTPIILSAIPVGVSQAASSNPITDATGGVYLSDSLGVQSYTATIDSSGNAVLQTVGIWAGSHSFSASYPGDYSYNQSTSPSTVDFTITKAPTTIAVTASPTTIFAGQVQLNVQLSTSLPESSLNNILGYGTITFTDTTNNNVLGSAPFTGDFCTASRSNCISGYFSVDVSQLPMGTNAIVASYSGDKNFAASAASAAVTVTCTAGCSNGTGQTLQFSFYQVSSGIISAGGNITATVSVNPGGGFTGPVNLTCSITGKNANDAHLPTCSLSPTQVSVLASNQAVDSTLTIKTTGPTSSALKVPGMIPWLREGGTALAVLLLFGLPAIRRARRIWAGFFLLVFVLAAASACGGSGGNSGGSGGGGGGGGDAGTTADTYTVTFHAADATTGTVTAQDYFTFTVQ